MSAPRPGEAPVVHESRESYDGPAALHTADGTSVELSVRLRGRFEPVDGLFHWWGRVAAHDALDDATSGSAVTVRTAYGEAPGRLSDRDPWGRYRVAGTGRPPF